MKIALDIRGVVGQPAGKGVWTLSVLNALLAQDGENEYYLYSDRDSELFSAFSHAHVQVVEGAGFGWHLQCYRQMLKHGIDLFLATESYIIPALHDPKKLRVFVVVHDLVAFKFSSTHQKKAVWIEALTLKKTVKKARHIFTVSESTKKDLLERYPVLADQKKTTVVHAGVRDIFLQPVASAQVKRVAQIYGLDFPYVVMAGTLEPRKNVEGVLEAYSQLSDSLKKKYHLVVAGKKGWYFDSIFQTVKRLNLEDRVHFLGFVPDEDLPALLAGAELFLFPSFYEGFGLPILEAMAVGVPVLTSELSSMPEVGGKAAIYANPNDPKSIAEGMQAVLEQPNLRVTLKEAAEDQLKRFSWSRTARMILEEFKK